MKDTKIGHLIKLLWDKLMTREMITYVISGVFTTIVNFLAYDFFCNRIGIPNLIANSIAWVLAVLFAYVTNNFWVFRDKSHSFESEIVKMAKFFGARLASFFVEQAGMFIFIDLLHFNNLIVKAVLAVFVIIINYVLSKLFIFNRPQKH
ncbi:MAG: GtrA family protein [Lachnospiraceae bacterium]|nr:GtrA family protein [Lachnospiraceae bacterium]